MSADEFIDSEWMLQRFHRLVGEVARGVLARNCFHRWEVEILLDLENCSVTPRRRLDILRQYTRAVERQLATSPGPPMKLSEFLAKRATQQAEPRP